MASWLALGSLEMLGCRTARSHTAVCCVSQDGVLTETATRVLASTGSFSATDAAGAANVAALQRVGSFPSPVGVNLAEALRTTAHAAPCGLSAPAPGGGGDSRSSPAAASPSSATAAAAAAADGADDEGHEGTSPAGCDARAAPGVGASPGQTAEGPDVPASGGAATEAKHGVGGSEPVARLRGGAGLGEHAPSRSNLATAGESSTSAAAASPEPKGSGSPVGAKPAKSPLAAAPVLGSSEAADTQNGGISAAAADSVGAGAGRGAGEGGAMRQERKKGSFLQKLSPLRLIRASGRNGGAGKARRPSASRADSQDEPQYAGQSEEDLRHEQVPTALVITGLEFL